MGKGKERVLLTGASGSMGFQTFLCLWEKREKYEIVILLRPSPREKKLFRKFEKEAGIAASTGPGTVTGGGLKIVWGDALNAGDVKEACMGIDWCLHVMALISPEADRNPEMAHRVNYLATKMIVEEIEAQDPDHIRMVYVGSVAEYGDRLPPVHVGRTGDPVMPSVYDHYALTKIGAELAVMQSRIRHRASLRQTFIMIPGLFSLQDPIMFHQAVNSFMENITARDSGRMLASALEVDSDSDFWGGYYNISGGPACRTTYYEFMERIYSELGLRLERVMERNWFALQNFHMMFFEDAERLNSYLHHWENGFTLEDYYCEVKKKMPWYLKATAWYCKYIPPYRWLIEGVTRGQLKKLANKQDGTLRWVGEGDAEKIRAFYGSEEKRQSIPGWGMDMPSLDHELPHKRLDHGYDESKEIIDKGDLKQAASFRGGTLEDDAWEVDVHVKVRWKCCMDHSFEMTPHAVLKGGHWCPDCLGPPWNYSEIAGKNSFVAQLGGFSSFR